MDPIKTEPDTDPLAIETRDDTGIEEKNPLLEEVNFFKSHTAGIKVECMDSSYDLAWDVKPETPEMISCNSLKLEPEEDSCDMNRVKEDLELEITTEEDEVLPDRDKEQFCHPVRDIHTNEVSGRRIQHHRMQLQERPAIQHRTEDCVQLEKPKSRKTFQCDTCSKCFTTKADMKLHFRCHIDKNCKSCGKDLAKVGNAKSHVCNHKRARSWKCNVCGEIFQSPQSGKKHLLLHNVKKSLDSPTKSLVADTEEKKCKCDICGKDFTNSRSFKMHLRIHTGKKPKCNICGRLLSSNYTLKAHIRIHMGDRPFKCEVCEKSFSTPGTLKKHKRIVHTGQKIFECIICGKTLPTQLAVRVHKRTHIGENSTIVIFPKTT